MLLLSFNTIAILTNFVGNAWISLESNIFRSVSLAIKILGWGKNKSG